MIIVKRDQITIPEGRQRTKIEAASLRELRDSILTASGLLHPPVVVQCRYDGTDVAKYELIAGGRRLAAIDSIADDGLFFMCGRDTILPGEVPVNTLGEITAAQRASAEFEENVVRVELSWQDKSHALAAIHKLRLAENPEQTVTDTAKELQAKSGALDPKAEGPTEAKSTTPPPDGGQRKAITESLLVVEHMNDPQVKNAKSRADAVAIIRQREETRWQAELVRRRAVEAKAAPDSGCLAILGDLRVELAKLEPQTFDLLFADPPYGQGADKAGYTARSAVGGHNYDDSPDAARELMEVILFHSARVCKPRANLFMFFLVDNWNWLCDRLVVHGWTPFPTPLIWAKSDTEGLAPWGRQGPRRTYEMIIYATRGQKGLISSPVDILRNNRVLKGERTHAAEKPVGLLSDLILCSTILGDKILDPCCGSGSLLAAARTTGRKAIGIEVDPVAHANAYIRAVGDPNAPAGPATASSVADL